MAALPPCIQQLLTVKPERLQTRKGADTEVTYAVSFVHMPMAFFKRRQKDKRQNFGSFH